MREANSLLLSVPACWLTLENYVAASIVWRSKWRSWVCRLIDGRMLWNLTVSSVPVMLRRKDLGSREDFQRQLRLMHSTRRDR